MTSLFIGPEGSPFEGGVFKLELFLPEDYPMSAPKVRFITKIYHPNIDKLGRICLDILKGKTWVSLLRSESRNDGSDFSDKWSPALQIRTVLLSIQALLSAPNPDDPLANDVAELWKVNEAEAIRNAKEWTRLYAMGNWTNSMKVALKIIALMQSKAFCLSPQFMFSFQIKLFCNHSFLSPWKFLDIWPRATAYMRTPILSSMNRKIKILKTEFCHSDSLFRFPSNHCGTKDSCFPLSFSRNFLMPKYQTNSMRLYFFMGVAKYNSDFISLWLQGYH